MREYFAMAIEFKKEVGEASTLRETRQEQMTKYIAGKKKREMAKRRPNKSRMGDKGAGVGWDTKYEVTWKNPKILSRTATLVHKNIF